MRMSVWMWNFFFWSSISWKGLNQGQIHVENGAFLKDIDHFDNVEFGISNKVARTMAPSTRKLIEHTFLALLDSGIDYRSRDVGCFMSGVIDKWTEVSMDPRYIPSLWQYNSDFRMNTTSRALFLMCPRWQQTECHIILIYEDPQCLQTLLVVLPARHCIWPLTRYSAKIVNLLWLVGVNSIMSMFLLLTEHRPSNVPKGSLIGFNTVKGLC